MRTFAGFMSRWMVPCLLALLLASCNGSAGTGNAIALVLPAPGDPQDFVVRVWNGTQFPLVVHVEAVGGPQSVLTPDELVPVGTELDVKLAFLPQVVEVFAQTWAAPTAVFPMQSFWLGPNFKATDGHVDASYP